MERRDDALSLHFLLFFALCRSAKPFFVPAARLSLVGPSNQLPLAPNCDLLPIPFLLPQFLLPTSIEITVLQQARCCPLRLLCLPSGLTLWELRLTPTFPLRTFPPSRRSSREGTLRRTNKVPPLFFGLVGGWVSGSRNEAPLEQSGREKGERCPFLPASHC